MRFQHPFLSLALASLLFCASALVPLAAPRADISGVSNSTDLSNMSADALEASGITSQDLQAQITDLKAQAIVMRAQLNAKTTTATESDYTKLVQQITDYEAAYNTLATNEAAQQAASNPTTSNSSNSGSSGSSLASSIGSGIASGVISSLLGGNKGVGTGTGGLGSLLGGTTGIGSAPTVATAPTGASTPAATTTSKPAATAAKTDDTKKADDKKKQCKAAAPTSSTQEPASTTAANAGKAADDNLNSGGLTANNSPGAQVAQNGQPADATAAQTDGCTAPQYNTPNPTGVGGKDTTSLHGSKITSIDDAKALVGQYQCDSSNSNCTVNGQQCASLTKAETDLGHTTDWNKGEQVQGNTDLAVGTPIATFCNGDNYGSGVSGCSHTGIYLGQNTSGIQILDQYNGSGGAQIHTIPWDSWGKTGQEGGTKYYTISTAAGAFLKYWLAPTHMLASLRMLADMFS